MSAEYTIFCDDCGTIIAASLISVGQTRREAKAQLGSFSAQGKDFCAACVSRSQNQSQEKSS